MVQTFSDIQSETVTAVVYVGIRIVKGGSQPGCCGKNADNGGLYNRAWNDFQGCVCIGLSNCGCIDNTGKHHVNPLLPW